MLRSSRTPKSPIPLHKSPKASRMASSHEARAAALPGPSTTLEDIPPPFASEPQPPSKDKHPIMTMTGRKRVLDIQTAFADDEEDDGTDEFARKKKKRAFAEKPKKANTPVAAEKTPNEKTPVAGHDETSMEAMALESLSEDQRWLIFVFSSEIENIKCLKHYNVFI